jgi:TP901 family phage tail tape measure protein
MANEIEIRITSTDKSGPGFRSAKAHSDGLASSFRDTGRHGDGLAGVLGKVGMVARGGLAGGLVLAGLAVRSTIKAGVDYQNQLNTMQAVTHATAEQMTEVAKRARDLGNDLSLPATSAGDAAQAMTELAKGNLTAQQAMDAAKGTLQLAAAAQISGAEAAKIQADALGAFALKAASAGHVADVLANAANSATGEISDFAQGLGQSGAVAHQFGMSVDQTVTSLALFANAGIHGSDAGTSLKSMLLALASPSKQAASALQTLGVHAFDARGKFVGLEVISGQLAAAHGRLSQEAFASATSIAFGSDAARAAGVLAANGAAGWDKMSAAIGRSGGAATAAAAKTKGLGGAWAGFKSQLETVSIDAFTAAAPAMERFVKVLSDGLPKALGAVKAGFKDASAPVAAVTEGIRAFSDGIRPIGGFIKDASDGLKPMGGFLADIGVSAGAATDGLKPMGDMLAEFGDLGPMVGDTAKLMGDGIRPIGPMIKQSAEEGRRAGLHRLFYDIGKAVGETVVFIRRNMPTWKQWAHVAAEASRLVGDALGKIGGYISRDVAPAMKRLIGWVNDNRFAFAEFGAATVSVLLRIGGTALIMAGYFVKANGYMIGAWQTLVHVALDSIATILHAAAASFGWIPEIGPKINAARDEFDKFSRGVDTGLSTAATAAGKTGDALIALGRSTVDAADKAAQLRRRMAELRSRALVVQAIDRATVVAGRIRTALGRVTGKTVRIVVNQVGDIQRIQREIDALTGRVISVKVGPVRGSGAEWKASGGIVGADTGGARGGLTWVGEAGRELVRLPYGSTVYPHGQSEGMAASSGGGGNTYNIAVTVAPGGHPADVGGKIVDLIHQYEQRSGHAWRTA